MVKISITEEDIKKCRDFASKKYKTTFTRLIGQKNDREKEERIFLGKLGELVFLNFLNSKGIYPNIEGLFEIWDETTKGDKFDFETQEGKSIDVKTAIKHFHKKIMVNCSQFDNGKCKDIYVGIKINEDRTEGEIWGFCSNKDLSENPKKDWGEGLAYWKELKDLEDIELLIKQF